jgi:hypothetical protein
MSTTAPNIVVWYGDSQDFGQNGNAQEWVNILGNVSDSIGIQELTYSLNGEDDVPLSMGTANKRLVSPGDFNIEIAYADLNSGTNLVEIKATNYSNEVSTANVTVNYTAGVTWPSNYDADWGSGADLQDIAQVVDGKWMIQGGNVIPQDVGYDRLLAIGDETWTDYEVTMPFTVKGIDPEGYTRGGPGIGLLIRWLGHNQTEGQPTEQPRLDWARVGGIGWYKWSSTGNEGLELRGRDWNRGYNSDLVLQFNVPYILKMSVQSSPDPADERSYYRLKMWKQGDPEPGLWALEAWSDTTASKMGSAVIVAHFVDVEIGTVRVRDIDDLTFTLTTSVDGNGSIQTVPEGKYVFNYGEQVVLKGIPGGAYLFDHWSGDITSTERVMSIYMTKDLNLTAHFAEGTFLPAILKSN